jgi:hypothetical protein
MYSAFLLVGLDLASKNIYNWYYPESKSCQYTANEGLVSQCLIPIHVFPERKLLFPKQNYNVLSASSYTHIYVRDLYISRIGLPILLQEKMWTNPGNI